MFSLNPNAQKKSSLLNQTTEKSLRYRPVKVLNHSFYIGAITVEEGRMVYGKYYKDSSGSSFFSQSTFVGEMAGINVWDRVLSEAEISEMSKSCTSGKGNIVSMVGLKIMGGVKKIPVSC